MGEKCGVAQGQEVHPRGSSKSPGPSCCQLPNWQKCPHRPVSGRGINKQCRKLCLPGLGLAWLSHHQMLLLTGLERNTAASGWALAVTWLTM